MKQKDFLIQIIRRSTGKGRGEWQSKEQPEESEQTTGELGTEETQPEERTEPERESEPEEEAEPDGESEPKEENKPEGESERKRKLNQKERLIGRIQSRRTNRMVTN